MSNFPARHNQLPDVPNAEGMLLSLAFARDPQAVLDEVSYAPTSKPEQNEMRFLPTATFREGIVRFGDDASDPTGRSIFPNNGTSLVVADKAGDTATVLTVSTSPDRKGRPQRVLTQSVINGMREVNPVVVQQETQAWQGGLQIVINVDDYAFVKAVRDDTGGGVCPELQELVHADLFTDPSQQQEFTFVAKALHAIQAGKVAA